MPYGGDLLFCKNPKTHLVWLFTNNSLVNHKQCTVMHILFFTVDEVEIVH